MTGRRIAKAAAACALFLSLCGTALAGKKKELATAPVPAQFSTSSALQAPKDAALLAEWWKNFEDPVLQSLIQRAIVSNLDVRVARAKLLEARATLRNTRAANQLPTVDLNGTYTRSRTSADNPQVLTLGGTTTTIPYVYDNYQAYFDASYEIDLFGGVRNTVKATRSDAEASADELRNTLISTLAEVAKDYIQLREYQEQLRIAREQAASQRDTVHITEVRNRAGLVSDLDVANARATVASTESTVPQLESKIGQQIHALALLLGKTPTELDAELTPVQALPTAVADIPAGLPSDLLRRRPDIRKAEANVQAAAARVGVQVSKLFPTITLTAQYGGQSGSSIGSLTDSAARFYSIGPTIQWGLLNYPALKANIRTYQAKRDQNVLTYQKTVLTAFQEVEDALMAYDKEKQRQKILAAEVEQYRRASTLALAKYTRGLTNFLDVLEAQRSLFTAEDSLAQSRTTVQTNLVSLYKALGGGWEKNDPVSATETMKNANRQ
jgi:NodT family efflux transporter outer membrane factor (OMF) lipoprotein